VPYARQVDLDAFVTVHEPEWRRLDLLARRRRLTGEEVDELVALYQRAATHLSVVQSSAPDPSVISRLSTTVARGRTAVAGGHEPGLRELARFVLIAFPAAVYRIRWWAIACAAGTLAISTVCAIWIANHPGVQESLGSNAKLRQLVEHDFADYYRAHPATSFAAQVWTNNALIALMCLVTGIAGLPVLYMLLSNALNIGIDAGVMAAYDRLDVFFGLILPHGLLELTAVFLAAGSGLQLFWAWIDPGPIPRAEALARAGRSMLSVGLGLVVVLLVSGVIEAFVTPSPLPTWARIGIGGAVWAAFLAYLTVFGRRAARLGETGDLTEELRGDVRSYAG